MELSPPIARVARRGAHRLIPSRYPSVGILDAVASPADLEAVFELEGWTNDRMSAELGLLHRIPKDEWVVGQPMATVVMASFCHPRPAGGRFNDGRRGAWYAAFALKTAHAEAVFHRTAELEEIGGWFDTFVQMADYLADFRATFHDLRSRARPGIWTRSSTSPGSNSPKTCWGRVQTESSIPASETIAALVSRASVRAWWPMCGPAAFMSIDGPAIATR